MSRWSLEYSIDVDEKLAVVFLKIHGIWKGETAERYHQDFREKVAPLLGQPWAKIADLTNWKTSYQEVTDVIGRHMEWSRANNVALQIYVLDNPSTYRQLNEMFVKGGVRDISHTFRTYEEAERFLKENWLDKRRERSSSERSRRPSAKT